MDKQELERLDDQGMSAWDTHDADAFVEIFADTFVINDVAMPAPITSRDAARAYAQAWFTAFPDMNAKQVNRVVGEDSIAAEIEFTGTNTGPMMMAGKQIPPTGKSVTGRATYFARAKDGRCVEFNSYPDIAGMMMQLGFMPEM
jgi:steroid delta-isomerase-like uncharacterized protein